MFANPLTDAIVKQFPDKFGAAVAAAPQTMPTTGHDMQHNQDSNMLLAIAVAGLLSAAGLIVLRRAQAMK